MRIEEPSGYTQIENRQLNLLIRGKLDIRKCPSCDNDGIDIVAYDENGEPCDSLCDSATRYPCEDCGGIGFIINYEL